MKKLALVLFALVFAVSFGFAQNPHDNTGPHQASSSFSLTVWKALDITCTLQGDGLGTFVVSGTPYTPPFGSGHAGSMGFKITGEPNKDVIVTITEDETDAVANIVIDWNASWGPSGTTLPDVSSPITLNLKAGGQVNIAGNCSQVTALSPGTATYTQTVSVAYASI